MKKHETMRWILTFILVLSTILFASCSSAKNDNNALTDEEVLEETTNELGTDITADKVPQDAKIIREITISGETKNFNDASQAIKTNLSEADGYIEKSDITGGENLRNDKKTAKRGTFVLRIPSEKLDAFLEQTKGLLNVTNSVESATDVTLEYYDIESRLNTLKSKKTALENMLEKAETINDILLIQDNLYQVIADIEAYQTKLNAFDNKVDYSTITLTVYEVIEYTEIEEEGFWNRVGNAFVKTWQNFGEFAQNFAVFLVYCMPVLVIFAIAAIIILIVWLNKRKHNNKK